VSATGVAIDLESAFNRSGAFLATALFRPLHAVINAPVIVFLAALTAMLFRPPDLKVFPFDRMAFALIIVVFLLRLGLRREHLQIFHLTWPMLGLMFLASLGALQESEAAQAWSLLAAKWIVPFAFFHIATSVFVRESALRKLEIFSLLVLSYLTLVSVLFLFDATSFIFPRFILDEGIGIHADRARGPLLQAVANGVCLNILGLIALDCFRRKTLNAIWALTLFSAVPLALLATRTRAVWLSAALSIFYLALFGRSRQVRKPALALCTIGIVVTCGAWLCTSDSAGLCNRLLDRSPVDFRLDMYRAGWQMFVEKPIAGWGSEATIQPEIERRISFHPERYLFHNTYLELAVERGLVGIALYAWLIICLFRLAKAPSALSEGRHFLDAGFRKLWPVILAVYLINASAVVMNYQFVNGFVFTIAGVLAGQNARLARTQSP
jgi:O-antigen ligase